MEPLGRLFNVVAVADDVYIDMRLCQAVTFICNLNAGDTWTLTEAATAGGSGSAVLPTLDRWYVQATVGAAWSVKTQVAASTIVTSASEDVAVITVNAVELSAGKRYVKLASTSTGTVVAILHELIVQRGPANLPALV